MNGDGDSLLTTSVKSHRKPVKDVGELFDDLINYLGIYGTYQKRLMFLVILPLIFFISFIKCLTVFVVNQPGNYFCSIPELTNDNPGVSSTLGTLHITSSEREKLMPFDGSRTPPHSQCRMWAMNYTELFIQSNFSMATCAELLKISQIANRTTSCQYGWEYGMERWDASVITEWHLVCEWSNAPTVLSALLVVAFILGIIVGGFCADRWGRKKVFFCALFVFIAFGLSSAFAGTFPAFVILAVIHSFGSGPLYYILYTIGVENLTLRSRVTFVVWVSIVYALGAMTFVLLAYFMRHWRNMTLIGTTPFFLLFIYWFFLPESPRWLLVHEHYEEVEHYFRNMAAVNGKPFDTTCQNYLKAIFNQSEREVDIDEHHHQVSRWKRAAWIRLFATPNMRRKTLLLLYLMCTLELVYLGLREFTPSMSGTDEYFNFFLKYLLEIPGYALTGLLCDRLGRRLTILVLFAATFVTCLVTLAFPGTREYFWGVIAVFFLAKIFYAGAYIVGELLMYETFPTVIRLQGIAFVESIAYAVSSIGPAISRIPFGNLVVPLIIFGCLGLVAMLCVFLIPETVSYALPETVEEADMRGSFYRTAVNLRVPEIKKFDFSVKSMRKKKAARNGEPELIGEKGIEDGPSHRTQPEVVTRPADQIHPPLPPPPVEPVEKAVIPEAPFVTFWDEKNSTSV